MVLLVLHLLQVLWAGAYRRPREFNWWFGMALLFLTLGFSLTGYLLPWDQKGYWATKVATNIMGGAPVAGPLPAKDRGRRARLRQPDGHPVLRPARRRLADACWCSAWRPTSRSSGATASRRRRDAERRPTAKFWPEQLFMDTVFSAAVVGVVIFLVLAEGGANLDAPADPSSSDYPARPEWYFLSLFQMLKLFPGDREMIGTIVIPTALVVVMMILPFLDRILPRKLAHFLACGFVFAVVGGAGYLTVQAMRADAADTLVPGVAKKGRRRTPARHLPGRPARRRHSSRRLRVHPAPGPAHPGPERAGTTLPGLPLLRGQGKRRRRPRPTCAVSAREPGFAACSTSPASATYFGKVAKFDGMAEWKKSSKLSPKQLDDVADFVASFAAIPDDMTTDDWVNSPGVSDHPGSRALSERVREVPRHRRLYRRRPARRPQALRLGISLVDRPDDPQAAIVG